MPTMPDTPCASGVRDNRRKSLPVRLCRGGDGEGLTHAAEGTEDGHGISAGLIEYPYGSRPGGSGPSGGTGFRPPPARSSTDADEVESTVRFARPGLRRRHDRDGRGRETQHPRRRA